MNNLIRETFGLLAMIVGVAILAVILSRQSNTVGVLRGAGDAFSGALRAATSPISGGGGYTAGLGSSVF